jgi:hypothetical protein
VLRGGRVGDGDLLGGRVDGVGGVVQQQLQPGGLKVGAGAMGQRPPVGHVAGQIVGQPADGEVRVGVGDQQGHLDRWVEFAGPEPGADPGVAAADHHQPHPASQVNE